MNCEEAAERMAEAWRGELTEGGRAELAAHLGACAPCRAEHDELGALWARMDELPEAEPSPRLRRRFEEMLAAELARERAAPVARPDFRARRQPLAPWVTRFVAVAATLAIGVLAGAELARRRDDRQIDALRREVASLHETVATALLAGGSAADRLTGVAYGRGVSARDARVADALLQALLHDPDVNVRLSALEALRPLAGRDEERPKLVAAIARQDSPLVQLSLIEVLLGADGESTRGELRRLLDDPRLDPAVRGHLRSRLGRSV